MIEETESSSAWPYLLIGVVIGAAVGVLYAPSAGSELRSGLSERGRTLADRIRDRLPARVKGAAVGGAIKSGGEEAFREAKDRLS